MLLGGSIDRAPFASEQSGDAFLLCIFSSACAGLGIGFFACLLSWAERQKKLNGGTHTRQSKFFRVLGVIGSTVFGLGSLVGLAFGPVTLVVIVRAGITLPANVLFSQVFRLRPLVRDDYLGTLVTLSGVVCFILFNGPPGPELTAEAYLEDLGQPVAMAWNSAVLASLFVSSGWICHKRKPSSRWGNLPMTLAVTNVNASASAFMDVTAKGWSSALALGLDSAMLSPVFWICVLLNLTFMCVMRWGMIYGCGSCDVLLFVPINTVENIFVSVATGLVVLQEWRRVSSWVGLFFSSLSVLGGIVLLVTGPGDSSEESGSTSGSPGRAVSSGVNTAAATPMAQEAAEDDTSEELARSTSEDPRQKEDDSLCWIFTTKSFAISRLNHRHFRAWRHRRRWVAARAMLLQSHVSKPASAAAPAALANLDRKQGFGSGGIVGTISGDSEDSDRGGAHGSEDESCSSSSSSSGSERPVVASRSWPGRRVSDACL
mmetsp:Transcript_71975/g.153943  ORF Transcript_71975/g.153943 Transcript_71975/m.153943 type:complete len:488 (-) Transcript_71975:19-1482(-)